MSKARDGSKKSKVEEFFRKARFDIEHALVMYALGFCTIPAEAIYEADVLSPLMNVIEDCHIYLIGYTPKIEFFDAIQESNHLDLIFKVLGREQTISYEVPLGLKLKKDDEHCYLENESGIRYWPDDSDIQCRLRAQSDAINFEVKYVGQAFGKDGSRNAVDRLLKHETLQKIALKGVPDGNRLTLLLLSVQPNNQTITTINPFAKNQGECGARITSGVDKLFNTTEAERISLYEAALIKYFCPEFNKEFKDSFPSTNLKILQNCYEKDFCAVIAEVCHDEIPFKLWSETVKPSLYHIAKHDLHKTEDRRMFFGL